MSAWDDTSIGTRGRLDDDTAFILAKAAELKLPGLYTMTPPEARAEFARRLSRSNPPAPEGVEAEDMAIAGPGGDLPIRLYRPGANERAGMLLYFHGGGFVVGDLDTHDSICRVIAARTGSVVAAVEYRLAPEHPYPAAVEDALAALRWLAAWGKGKMLGVAGDSAGGTLAAVVARHARDLDIPLALHMPLYPAVDQSGDFPSRTRLAEGHLLTETDIQWFTRQYFGPRPGPVLAPDASPLRAESLAGIAPALVLTCGFDPLADEGRAYVQALRSAGVPARHVRLEGAIHGCLGLAAYLQCGKTALDELCAAWLSALGG